MFNAKNFLGRADVGKKIKTFAKGRNIFAQGEVADSVFYIQKGKVKVTVLSENGKEAVVGFYRRGSFLEKVALMVRNCALPQPMRWRNAFSRR